EPENFLPRTLHRLQTEPRIDRQRKDREHNAQMAEYGTGEGKRRSTYPEPLSRRVARGRQRRESQRLIDDGARIDIVPVHRTGEENVGGDQQKRQHRRPFRHDAAESVEERPDRRDIDEVGENNLRPQQRQDMEDRIARQDVRQARRVVIARTVELVAAIFAEPEEIPEIEPGVDVAVGVAQHVGVRQPDRNGDQREEDQPRLLADGLQENAFAHAWSVPGDEASPWWIDLMMKSGRCLVCMYVRPRYSPMIARQNICIAPKVRTMMAMEVQPGAVRIVR